ncbi:HAMP domain-containing sensor histidine kinase [Flavitalea sp. BT771]|uniref:sensor histidine kinase n=1 Tax=Flavitalea sp. BT771 TaxID=3063329 RepID=UPI0026E1F4C6|nr:HAMP domain-containing sensor histidine kinase [Flavitalea sp. BT771]MDO6434423.1 HAMP domain-containing sensor histidine kinase [Flavitalea sp. BT771]MDV6223323.1 HAMP domain-containing sensor histidine kinase [Flavitalea sp. BT771]
MNKLRISITLMVLTIAAIVLFQAYWLKKSYAEESKVLTLRTQLLFRETLFKLQATKLHFDTTFHIMPDPSGLQNMATVIRDKVTMDSAGKKRRAVVVSVSGRAGASEGVDDLPDSGMHRIFYRASGPGGGAGISVADFLSGVDSLQDSVTVKEIDAKFRQVLDREGIRTPFTVLVGPVDRKKNIFFQDSAEQRVILGFANPMSYQLRLGDTFWLTARRLGPQALFSLVLVGVTIFSFLLLYRNWRGQQKLILLKNDFISNITHELKTPIATVSVAVEALKEFDALKDPVRTREYLEISTHELQRLSLLVDKVLKLSLYERQEIELRKDEFDMKVLVKDVMTSMRLQFEKSKATVRLTAGPEEPGIRVVGPGRNKIGDDGGKAAEGAEESGDTGKGKVEPAHIRTDKYVLRADKLHFTSVIFNLLDNALKYGKAAPIMVLINIHWEPDFLLLTVGDNGIGIPADYKDRIFEKFFRVPMGDQHNVKGYGLGLSYVAYVVQRHGGEIMVRSKEGVGSEFTIKIPRGYA